MNEERDFGLGLPVAPERARAALAPGVERDLRGFVLRRLLIITDVVAMVVALVASTVLSSLLRGNTALDGADLLILVFGVPVWIVFARIFGLYHVDTRRVDHSASEEVGSLLLMTTLWSWLVLFAEVAGGAERAQLLELFVLWATALITVPIVRSLTRHWARGRDWYRQNALIVGGGRDALLILTRLQRHPEYGVHVLACVDPNGESGTGPTLAGVPVISGAGDLLDIVETLAVERVIVASSAEELSDRSQLLHDLAGAGVHVDAVPRDIELLGSRSDLHHLEGLPLITLPVVKLARSSLLLKRATDLAVSVSALIVLSPLFAYLALRIKFDSQGPVFFKQDRVGRDNEVFKLVKFRSMVADADLVKHEVAEENVHGGGLDSGMFKVHSDPRITRFGAKLRRHSLDELPQLWNVVKGDMSLVGPRPLIPSEDSQVVGRFRNRMDLGPGMTGMWQVLGRSDIPFEDMVRLDYLYVTNWSLGGDMKLLLRTIGAVLRGKGAY